ncbi:MAG: right-handed parallel beta-helix repeat-containing protein [Desulfovibrio sp.]|nr:right-handed parallel beta-helix repeat-containing protein [Desulfovibrio sp.]
MAEDSVPLPYWVENGRRVLYVTYKGDCRTVRIGGVNRLFATHPLAGVFSCVSPGDIVQLLPGTYWAPILFDEDTGNPPACKPVKLAELYGTPHAPITIRGLGASTSLNGGLGGVPHDSMLPQMKHFAFFKLADCAWIEFENLHVSSCWPTFLYIQDSSYVTVRDIVCTDSRYMVYARGQTSHHILLERNHWRQDPTNSVWRDILWLDSKRKRYFYYNGGIFGSYGISGSVVIRDNIIQDSFNGMRMKADKKARDSQNHNVEFYGNRLERVRDNPVEPERSAMNWWIHHNDIRDAHAWFSLDEVAGGYWYFFGNRGVSKDVPGTSLDPNRGGKVYKYDAEGPMPDKPVFAFNNSYWLRSSLIKEGATTLFTHRDNAVLFPPQTEPGPDQRFLGPNFMPDGWVPGVSFDHDLTNVPWPPKITDNAQEQNGRMDPEARFVDPDKHDLHLAGQTPRGCPVVFEPGADWPGRTRWTSGPDTPVGAYAASGRPVEGPAFVFLKPADGDEGYVEAPRLVRLETKGTRLTLSFSTPLAQAGPVHIRVKAGGTTAWVDAAASDRDLTAELPGAMAGRRVSKIWLPSGLQSADGEYATGWSSVFAGLRFYKSPDGPDPRPPEPVCFCDCGRE